MNTQRILRSLLLASALISTSARAADPQPAAPGAADIQALMAILNKLVAPSAAAATAADTEPEPAPGPAARAPATLAGQPFSTALKTGCLSTGGLAGRGPGLVARLTDEAWRLLFPVKQPGR